MSSSLQNILILAGIVLLVGLGYFIYTQNDSAALNIATGDGSVSAQTAQFLRRLSELERMSLDTSVLTEKEFDSLVRFSQPHVTEPFGTKLNPFMPNGVQVTEVEEEN